MPITRTAWIDDDGSATTGTVINNAEKTALYNQVDAATTGAVYVTAFGTHSINAAGAGAQTLQVVNSQATGDAQVNFVGQAGSNLGGLYVYNQANSDGGYYGPSKTLLIAQGSGGLSIAAIDAAGAIRFYAGGTTQRWLMPAIGGMLGFSNHNIAENLILQTSANVSGGTFVGFNNAAGTRQGSITATSATVTAYNTGSDARLKHDLGLASDLTGLRALVVHDFEWLADGSPDRGIFAQEAYAVFPRAIVKGDDERTAMGQYAHPWMTDYSRFVPDLIVGWQQHDRRLAHLETLVTEKR